MLLRCLLLLLAGNAYAKPQLTWLQTDWPPHQIVSGPFQGQGTFDLLLQQLSTAMPQFEHQTRLVNLARLEQAFLQQEPALCALGTLYSEQRAQNRLFSVPLAVGPALAVGYITGKLTAHPAMQDNGADIHKLALDRTLTGAYQPNRLYPEIIEPLLRHPDSNLTSHAFTSEVNAAGLLAGNRVDYVVEYPERMQYYNLLLPQAATLEHRAIAGANVASVSYITCSTDEVGQAAITAVNQLLPALWQQAEYIQAMQRWLDDSARRRLSTDLEQLQQQALMQLKPRPDDAVDAGH
ncbi:hypothetical protein [Rheinheimera sp.]|uniref:hypothetical protein n=1 Tax=Rheinheimera sp. TaxID=1869214 RepID=UPI002732996E|nr:hypothetical protein [Rheinheimera sp.]MDP2714181.1 hypothetical protein [Rheinheimera sp.]